MTTQRVNLGGIQKDQPDFAFARYQPGPFAAEAEIILTRADVERWTGIHGDRSAWTQPDIAPPAILYYPSQNLLGLAPVPDGYVAQKVAAGGGGLARYAADLFGPVPVGRRIVVRGEITAKYVRRGRGYVEWTSDYVDGDRLIQRQLKSWMFPIVEGDAERWPDTHKGERPRDDGEGTPFGSLDALLTLQQFVDFEGPDNPNDTTHTNLELAQKAGFPSVRAQGGIPFGLLARLMTHYYGDAFLTGGSLDIRLLNPAYAGETLALRGEVTGQTETHLVCRVSARKPDGTIVAAGTATARRS